MNKKTKLFNGQYLCFILLNIALMVNMIVKNNKVIFFHFSYALVFLSFYSFYRYRSSIFFYILSNVVTVMEKIGNGATILRCKVGQGKEFVYWEKITNFSCYIHFSCNIPETTLFMQNSR